MGAFKLTKEEFENLKIGALIRLKSFIIQKEIFVIVANKKEYSFTRFPDWDYYYDICSNLEKIKEAAFNHEIWDLIFNPK